LTEPETVGRRRGEHEHAPAGEVILQLELEASAPATIENERRIPVAHELERRAHAERRASVAARIRALLLDALPADETREQAVVQHVEAVEPEEAAIRIEGASPARHEVEHGLVEHRDRHLDRLAPIADARRGLDLDANGLARLVRL